MPSRACRSSIVTETLTSEVVTTSTGVRKRSNTSKTRRRKPYAISMRVEAMSIRVRPRLQAIAAGPPSPPSTVRVISVPGASGRCEFRMRTGMPRRTAGRIVLGCSTLAPK